MRDHVLIVGAGQAAAAFIATLRMLAPSRPITLVGDEPLLPYRRPPLSKAWLEEEFSSEALLIRPPQWYEGIDLRLGRRVEEIDRRDGRVTLSNGDRIAYDQIFLSTGSSARRLEAELGGELAGVYTLRSAKDAQRLKAEIKPGRRLLVLGGGYVGLEVAAAARKQGMSVLLIEAASRVLSRVASAATAEHLAALHRARGVEIREGVALLALLGPEHVRRAVLSDGTEHEIDVVVVGIGGVANDEVASAAGLDTANGIIVNASCRTSDPRIMAAGDCALFPLSGRLSRLESVQNANDQGETAAACLAGEERLYKPVPWFWSDQFETKLQIVGLGRDHDTVVVRPGQREGTQSIWYFRGGQLLAVDAINDPSSYMIGRKLLAAGVSPDVNDVREPAFSLATLLPRRR
ncbi:NAD(P)/FAD-dependent oxidoreductase [Ensifer sp. YR511]|uniref:NAD(P)/FAD-dependent oxidoreductase n=1 Tax=Ensifer sp. YR511 TaxID=1855294 RepID=UPI000885AADC|nr:FAD-dependent oxidoreductase [Ensifer sp. YR511]SDN70740.1 3-phenylpropionate/trans-cinnamate dioxygenase ferredoxin reductase subunit [Ensifer sp. YR511]